MNCCKKIIISKGWEPDQNNALAEVVIPSMINTLNAPHKVTFMGQTLNYMPTTIEALQEFEATNMTSCAAGNFLKGYTSLTRVVFPKLVSIPAPVAATGNGFLGGCTSLLSVDMPSLLSIGECGAYQGGQFGNCTSLVTVNMPALQEIGNVSNNTCGQFYNCTNLATVNFPKLQRTTTSNSNGGTFYNCINLQHVTFGSEGNPVTSLGAYTFKNCSQSGLTITVFTADGNPISGSPWGATNATIIWEEA